MREQQLERQLYLAVPVFTYQDFFGRPFAQQIITSIHFNRQKVYIRHILTHSEYDKDKWKT